MLTDKEIRDNTPDGDDWKYGVGFPESTKFARAIESAVLAKLQAQSEPLTSTYVQQSKLRRGSMTTKETLMQLAVTYAECFHFDATSGTGNVTRTAMARQKLECAIDAALKQARSDALEDAADRVFKALVFHSDLAGAVAAEIRTLKGQV